MDRETFLKKVGFRLKQQGIGESHAKIILIGEHSVVYGQPAIALPLPNVQLKATLTADATTSSHVVKSSWAQGNLTSLPESMAGIQKLISTLMERFDGQDDGWTLEIESMLPSERGMGSSAATAIAIVRAFFDLYETSLDRSTLLKLADVEEQITHRSPSGLDAATTSSDQPIYFVKGQPGQPIELNLHATMVIADTGVKGATKEAIMAVRELLATEPQTTQNRLEHLGQLTKRAQQLLSRDDADELGRVLNLAQDELSELNVSDESLDHLIRIARQNGALGAKLTGGGRGGCMFALTKTALGARRLAGILKDHGAVATWIQPLAKGDEE